jgi:type I restriction enzyme, S subunit
MAGGVALAKPEAEGPWPLPEGWSWVAIDDVVDPVGTTDPKRDLGEKKFHYIDLSALENGRVANAQLISGLEAPSRARQVAQAGDTLFSCVRVYLQNIALLGTGLRNPVASTAYCVMRPGPAVEPRYLNFFVRSRRFIEWMIPLQRGNSPPAVLDADVKAQPFPLPPLAEQRRIVARIDALFAEIAEGEAALAAARDGLDTFRRALLKAAVTGELTEEWRAENPAPSTGHDLVAGIIKHRNCEGQRRVRGRRSPEAATIDASELPRLPETWCWAFFRELFDISTGSTPSRSDPTLWNGAVPWVSSGEVAFCRIKSTRETISTAGLGNAATRLNPVGTVLLAMIGEGKTRGQCAILDVPAANNQNAAAIRVSATPIPPEYVYHVLEERYFRSRRESQGGNQPALNAGKVGEMPIPVPPLNEIDEILRRVSEALSVCTDTQAVLDTEAADAARLKQSILKAAFEGRLVPQDSTEEPAAALLERLATTAPAPDRAKRGRGARSHA